jgi:hypothetical protein
MTPHGLHSHKTQSGAVTVIAAILFLAIIGIMSIVVNNISGTMLTDANTGDKGLQLDVIAESGLERAFYQLKTGVKTCGAIADSTLYTVGTGTFEIKGGVLTASTCQVTVVARPTSGSSSRTLTGSISVGYSFLDSFPDITAWGAPVLSQNRGTYAYIASGCPTTTCTGATGGALQFITSSSGSDNQYSGYMQRTISSLVTGGSGVNVRWSLGLAKGYQGGSTGAQTVQISLLASATGTETFLTTDSTLAKNGSWYSISGTTSLAGSKTYDKIRVYFDLQAVKSFQTSASIDEIRLNSP